MLKTEVNGTARKGENSRLPAMTAMLIPGRIWKIYGTMACKGDNLPERPHRLAQLLAVPAPLLCVTPAQLADLAALLPAPRRGMTVGHAFDLPQWITDHALPVVAEGPWQKGGYKWILNPCPWNSSHTNKSAFVVQLASGAIAARCHHNGCQGNDWHALRDLYEPGWRAARGTPKRQAAPSPSPPPSPGVAAGLAQAPTPLGHASFLTDKSGQPREMFNNLVLALEQVDPWATQSWYDRVRDRGMVDTHPLDEAHVWESARAIEQHTQIPVRNLKLVASALRHHCLQTPRDLIQEWLAGLPPWDSVVRLTEWLCDYAEVPKTAYTMAVARLLPVSMVARALPPGIQCRSVVIFEGAQEIGKSELAKAMAGGDAWYREVSGTLEGKEAHMLMKGVWVVELSEMDVMLRTEESRVKSFITMANDEYVPKYANDPVKLARRTILIGTINPEGDGSYLRDQTGATRYYPVPVGHIALDDIRACRDQLFAEALVWFQAHPADWWALPPAADDELTELREARRKEGVFEGPRLQEWLDRVRLGTAKVTAPFHTEDALRYCFQMSAERWTAANKDQVGKAIAKYGWVSKSSRASGRVQRLWHACPPV
jgi:hypothetical protein